MTDINKRGYCASESVERIADEMLSIIGVEIPPEHHRLMVPAAMFQAFAAHLRNGGRPTVDEACSSIAQGLVSMLEAVARSSRTDFRDVYAIFGPHLHTWLNQGSGATYTVPKSHPDKRAS